MCLEVLPGFDKSALTAAAYSVQQGCAAFAYHNVRLVRLGLYPECVGSTHEYYNIQGPTERLDTLRIADIGDGGCKAHKYKRDIKLLRADVERDPSNARAHFYLANSYKDTGQWEAAARHYRKRIAIGGWYEEVWYSHYNLGKCLRSMGRMPEAIAVWLEGYNFYPGRMENLYEIVKHYREDGKSELAHQFYQWAKAIPKPVSDNLFIHHNIYDYALDYEYTVFYYYLKDRKRLPGRRIHALTYAMLRHGHHVPNVLSNYKFYAQKLAALPGVRSVRVAAPDMGGYFEASTPALVAAPGGRLLANVRHNNTGLTSDMKSYTQRGDREVTRNQWAYVDRDGVVSEAGEMSEDNAYPDRNDLFAGRQDVRLLRAGEKVLYTATVCAEHGGARRLCMEHGEYDLETKRLRGTVIPSPRNAECEKNWCLFEHEGAVRCIYGWSPIVVGALEGGRFVEQERWTTPGECRAMRGSTPGAWRGGELWFGVHLVSYEEPRHYYHALVAVDPARRAVLRMTYPFKLEDVPIEYVCSLDFPDEHTVRLAYSLADARPSWLEVPVGALQWHTPAATVK